MKAMTAVEAKNSFGQLLEATLREPVAVTKNRREVAAMFSMEDIRALADSFLAAPLKADVAAGKVNRFAATPPRYPPVCFHLVCHSVSSGLTTAGDIRDCLVAGGIGWLRAC